MRLPVKQFIAVAHQTTREATRQPICVLLTAFAVLFTALLPFLVTHTFGESSKVIRDSALALYFLLGLLLSGFLAGASLATEFRQGMASSILTKPVNRHVFFLAKYAGLGVVMLLYACSMSLLVLLSDYVARDIIVVNWRVAGPLLAIAPVALILAGAINFLSGRNFASTAFTGLVACTLVASAAAIASIPAEGVLPALHWQILYAGILGGMAILLFTGMATLLATRLDTTATLLICLLIFVLGLMSDHLIGRHAEAHTAVALLYAVVPNWQHFWMADALSSAPGIPAAYLLHAGVYTFFYLASVLCLGMLSIQRLDLT
ncbi:MAG: hypothetical protein EOM20_14090 [Spartobacteria bacterium]|nr:hypothetical protein [Spartobacteria bacterium]